MLSTGGVAHTSVAREAGFSGRSLAQAVADGTAERVRRSWLVLPDADPALAAAAAAGGRLSCVSAAARAGLWVPPADGSIHVSVKATASRVDAAGLTVHWATGPAPMRAHSSVDHLLNTLFHVARCLSRAHAFAVWESAARTSLVSPEELRRTAWHSTAAAALAEAVGVLSDSGIESVFVRGIRALGLPVQQQVWIDGHPLDARIGEKLLVQIDGFAHHSTARDRRRDIEADARLVLQGFTVLRFDWYQVLFDWPYIERTILGAVAQGLHLAASARRA